MQTRTNALVGITLLLLAVATYVVLAGRAAATSATTAEPTPPNSHRNRPLEPHRTDRQ